MEESIQLPIWGGIECTINRIHDFFLDQLEFSGHYHRSDDLQAIADLGIKQLRYPVLWERHQPQKNTAPDFSWAGRQLEELRKLSIKPIVGLVHHGSGPRFTNLLDPQFPFLLAKYAKQVATAFPWVEQYTPVNEPLTTARFSGLYGLWFPHERNDVSFARMLLNQLKGVVLSMAEIRKVNPNAVLVQTEDLGKTYSTPLLKYQAKCENDRRWLTYDFLCGMVTKEHPLYDYFLRLGISIQELEFFSLNPCPPDLIGVNHYVTSERYIDEDLSKYPESSHGGNQIHSYADVEAVRVKFSEPHGFEVLMREMWDRYHIPMVVTEAHLHCSREEQMKWFRDIYDSSCRLAAAGIDVRAVTVWSILGAYGWNKLLTTLDGDYERGTFDVSSGNRRPTAMATMIKSLTASGSYDHQILQNDGWWKSESRYFSTRNAYLNFDPIIGSCQPLLIIGKTGTLGKAFSRICKLRALNHVLAGREEIDICDISQIEKAIKKYHPWAIVNAAGYVRVDDAENEKERCHAENCLGVRNLATACKRAGIRLLTYSSDLVFDGSKNQPYLESDAVSPLNAYGQSKADAEMVLKEVLPESLIIRTSAFFGPWDEYNFVHAVLETLQRGEEFFASGEIITPTYVPHLVNASLDLLIDEEKGIWHLTNHDAVTWMEFAVMASELAGFNSSLIRLSEYQRPAKMPKYSALGSENGKLMPSLSQALSDYFEEILITTESR